MGSHGIVPVHKREEKTAAISPGLKRTSRLAKTLRHDRFDHTLGFAVRPGMAHFGEALINPAAREARDKRMIWFAFVF